MRASRIALCWFRRDLCDYDHAALMHALARAQRVYCVFVFDRGILDRLDQRADRRVEFIWESVRELDAALRDRGGGLIVRHGHPVTIIPALAPAHLAPHLAGHDNNALAPPPRPNRMPAPEQLGFKRTNLAQIPVPTGMRGGARLFAQFVERIDRYHQTRDFPATPGTSNLSVRLRFGTVSIRALAGHSNRLMLEGSAGAATWLAELIWRDFYFMTLDRHPHVVDHAFRQEFDAIPFPNNPDLFAAWCAGQTGYPLVDAAMRQLNALPAKYIHAPWKLAPLLQHDLGVVVGRDYPHPVVDHVSARKTTLTLYKVSGATGPPDLIRPGRSVAPSEFDEIAAFRAPAELPHMIGNGRAPPTATPRQPRSAGRPDRPHGHRLPKEPGRPA